MNILLIQEFLIGSKKNAEICITYIRSSKTGQTSKKHTEWSCPQDENGLNTLLSSVSMVYKRQFFDKQT